MPRHIFATPKDVSSSQGAMVRVGVGDLVGTDPDDGAGVG
jgi:hypothetical protein